MTTLRLPPALVRAGCTIHVASDDRIVVTLPDGRTCDAPATAWVSLVLLVARWLEETLQHERKAA